MCFHVHLFYYYIIIICDKYKKDVIQNMLK